jgi:hypothetical protein
MVTYRCRGCGNTAIDPKEWVYFPRCTECLCYDLEVV